MAWRPVKYLIEGELDNTTPGKVTGWLRFKGMSELVSLDLRGDFHRDIRGATLRIRPREALRSRRYMDGFATLQSGDAGDITAGRPPHDYGEHPYIEWYGPNGRVVIALAPEEVEVVGEPIPWEQAQPVDRDHQDELMADHIAAVTAALERETGRRLEAIIAVFDPGEFRYTEEVLRTFAPAEVHEGLRRHLTADWGDIDRENRRDNDRALRKGGALISSYRTRKNRRFFIVTMPDRRSTTVCLPEEAAVFMTRD